LASAIITLLKDKYLATRLGEKGRERVEKFFTIEKMINQIEELLDEMSQ
jgi:glycosyltransferase involved in cell wall biosynthesis